MSATYRQIDEELTAAGQFFEIEIIEIDGVATRAWKNAPRTIGSIIEQGAAAAKDRDYLVLDDERLTHRQHLELVHRLASSLVQDLGVAKGDRVAIAMRNLPDWSIAFWATTMIGGVVVAVNAFGNGEDIAFALDDSSASVVIADGERLERMATVPDCLRDRVIIGTHLDDRPGNDDLPRDIRPFDSLLESKRRAPTVDIHPDDPATIFFTSGTTSRPKGVLGTHRNICTNVMTIMFSGARSARRNPNPSGAPPGPSVNIGSTPLFHATGCHSGLVGGAFFGGTIIFIRRWDPELVLDIAEREGVTSLGGVPTMLWDLMNSPTLDQRDLSNVRTFGGGGAASPPELERRIRQKFPNADVVTGYGLTETSSIVTTVSGQDYHDRPASVGVPIPICEVRIVDDRGCDLPVGTAGEIWIKGPNVVKGYWQRPEETAATFANRWLRTGDIGRFDEDGFLFIVDRAKDIIIRGGENISSLEVESALIEHPEVLEVAVFATPHPTLGEEVGAVVRHRSGAAITSDEIRAHAATRLAAHKVPSHVWLREDPLPRGDTGKLLKRMLKDEYTTSLR